MSCGNQTNCHCGCTGGQKPRGLGFLFWDEYEYAEGGGGWDDWGSGWGGYTGSDMWGFSNPFWGNGGSDDYDPLDEFTDDELAYLCSVYPSICGETVYSSEERDRYLPAPAPNVPLAPVPLPNWVWDPFSPNFGGYELPPAPPLPGYCPGGTYHPVGDPYSCVPFPPDKRPSNPRQRPGQQQQQQQRQQQKQQQPRCPAPMQFDAQSGLCKCPPRTVLDPRTKKCVRAEGCPAGYTLDQRTGQCIATALANRNQPGNGKDFPWGLLGLLGLLALAKKRKK